jgi:hypothetical protein
MAFKVKKLEDGKFGLYNTTKKEMSKRSFKSKESAEKMGLHYQNFSQLRKKKEETKEPLKKKKKEEPKEEKEE